MQQVKQLFLVRVWQVLQATSSMIVDYHKLPSSMLLPFGGEMEERPKMQMMIIALELRSARDK